MWTIALAAEEAAEQVAPPQSPFQSMFPMLVVFIAIMYFLMIRPAQKREKVRRALLDSLTKGDKVVTSGGITGTIVGLSDRSIVLRVSDDPIVKMEFVRGAVSQVLSDE